MISEAWPEETEEDKLLRIKSPDVATRPRAVSTGTFVALICKMKNGGRLKVALAAIRNFSEISCGTEKIVQNSTIQIDRQKFCVATGLQVMPP